MERKLNDSGSLRGEAGLAMFAFAPFLGHLIYMVYGLVGGRTAESIFTNFDTFSRFSMFYFFTLVGAYIVEVVPSAVGTLIYAKLTHGVQRLAQRLATAAFIGFLVSLAWFLPVTQEVYFFFILTGAISAGTAAFLFDRSRESNNH